MVEVRDVWSAETGLTDEERECLRYKRLRVGDVAEVVAQGQGGKRVDRLHDEDAPRPERPRGELEEADEYGRLQMLQDVGGEHPAEGGVLQPLEVRDGVGLDDVDALAPRERDHVRIDLDPARLDARLAEQLQELAAAAADVEDGGGRSEVLEVRALPFSNVGDRAAHPRLEGEVIDGVFAPGALDVRTTVPGVPPPLQPEEALLELGEKALLGAPLLDGTLELFEPRELLEALLDAHDVVPEIREPRLQLVDEPQHGVVEVPLVGGERADVPTHELAEDALDGDDRAAAKPPPALDRNVDRHRREPVGVRARGECAGGVRHPVAGCARRPAHLLLEALKQRCNVHTLGRNACRYPVFGVPGGHRRIVTGCSIASRYPSTRMRSRGDSVWTEEALGELEREFGDAYAGRTVVVTGADGFMGSHVTEALVALDANVVAFVRATSSGALNNIGHLQTSLHVVFADLTDRTSVDFLVRDHLVDAPDRPFVFHLAAQAHVGESWHRPYETVMANTVGTLNLLQSVVDHGVELEKFDTAGTSEEYGNVREAVAHHHDFDDTGGLILHERSPINPKSVYATSKVAADFLTMNYHDAYGVPGVVTRMFNNYGPRQNPRYVTGTIVTQALQRERVELGNLEPMRDFCFCTDGVRGHLTVAARGIPGDVYVYGQGKNITMGDWAALILRIGEEEGYWPERELVSVPERYRPGASDVVALRVGYEKLHRETGWEPLVSWDEGIARTIRWYAENRSRWIGRVDWLVPTARPERAAR